MVIVQHGDLKCSVQETRLNVGELIGALHVVSLGNSLSSHSAFFILKRLMT